jgi:transcriptional regulator with XRE-family HTH domain
MGRLTKKKIDQIAKLRSQGYTQIEVAEKVGVCLKTVRKYDPGSIAGSAKEWQELQGLPERVKKLEEIAKTLSALATSYQFEKGDEFVAWCPKCNSEVTTKRMEHKKTKKSYYGCSQCGTPIPYAKYFDDELADIFT